MNDDLRKRLLIIGGAGIVVIAAIFAIYYFVRAPGSRGDQQTQTTDNSSNTATNQSNGVIPVVSGNQPVLEQPVGEPEDIYLRNLARIFVERTQTYSNNNGGDHLAEAEVLATDRVISWLRSGGRNEVTANNEYFGLTTTVIMTTLKEKKVPKAVVTVGAQEVKQIGSKPQTISYRSGRVELLQVDGVWKVDGLYWE